MRKEQVYEILNKVYFGEERHEKRVIDRLSVALRGASLFVDIGASLGQYTYFANKVMREGLIIAVEPDPIRFEELARNCEKWRSFGNNELVPINAALSDSDGKIRFYTTKTNVSGGLFVHEVKPAVLESSGGELLHWEEIIVDCCKLDTVLAHRMPDIVKIDVEGAELRVLRGAENTLRNGRTRFLVELHGGWADPDGQKDLNDVYRFMERFGYQASDFAGHTLFARRGLVEQGQRWLRASAALFRRAVQSQARRTTSHC
ncbi:MAG TPA: FkbM family methyltransferase [Candidatus Eisenbacteria bacterium]|nr:FkbM family methyltransferase [Candidatus Eisenbacteria bacterium]